LDVLYDLVFALYAQRVERRDFRQVPVVVDDDVEVLRSEKGRGVIRRRCGRRRFPSDWRRVTLTRNALYNRSLPRVPMLLPIDSNP
jgi:hypothetical protein